MSIHIQKRKALKAAFPYTTPIYAGGGWGHFRYREIERDFSGATKALELVGPKTLFDTLCCMEKGDIVCNTGVLGVIYGINGFDPTKYISNGVYLTGFFSNYPTTDIMEQIFVFLEEHHLKPMIGATYAFKNIRQALIGYIRNES